MKKETVEIPLQQCLGKLSGKELSLLDFLPDGSFAEKIIDLVLNGPPPCPSSQLAQQFRELVEQLDLVDTRGEKVVIFGGGSGLSNIFGGDSHREEWKNNPFTGLKEVFANISSIVCVTDDGGSTGELLKDLPLVGLGDLRHVLLSSIRKRNLQQKYGFDDRQTLNVAQQLHGLFNYRFTKRPGSAEQLIADSGANLSLLPNQLQHKLLELAGNLFTDSRLTKILSRPQCLGNLFLAASIYEELDSSLSETELVARYQIVRTATVRGIASLAEALGGNVQGVLPCTTTIAQLQVLYENGVLVTSEFKSGHARRSYPVDRVLVEFFYEPFLPSEIVEKVEEADILIFAPGSLYSSIIPILQVPGLADAIKKNEQALKILIANIWVQKGETDVSRNAPNRKFHVSDLIQAYNRNIPGGVQNLFSTIIALKLGEIPGSVLQSYALEDKEPIYIDEKRVRDMGFELIEASIFSRDMLEQHGVIQHDSQALALAIKTLSGLKNCNQLRQGQPEINGLPLVRKMVVPVREDFLIPCKRYEAILTFIKYISTDTCCNGSGRMKSMGAGERNKVLETVLDIIWSHPDILIDHLRFVDGITLIEPIDWSRCQEWDNVFSFYDPKDKHIKIRKDQFDDPIRFEVAFLVALGQSLLGNYVFEKNMEDVLKNGELVGHMYRVVLRDFQQWNCFFSQEDLGSYLRLARMRSSAESPLVYLRLVNGTEGFTPPGLLFGLFYAWYLDNRFSAHIEYKMAIMKHKVSNLIPEQVRIVGRREGMVKFFREKVFRHNIIRCKCAEQG